MRVTVLISEDIIKDVARYAGGENLSESLAIALKDYVDRQRIKKLIRRVKKNPLKFSDDFNKIQIRKLNRKF